MPASDAVPGTASNEPTTLAPCDTKGSTTPHHGHDKSRMVLVGSRHQKHKFPTNEVKTSIYTPLNFLPKNMFKQFTRFSNIYFLFITALQLIPEVTSTPGFPTMIVPLVFIIVVSAVRDLIEDLDRHRADSLQNRTIVATIALDTHVASQKPQVFRFVDAMCADLRVGELVRIDRNEELPADVVLLAASHLQGQCFVTTANLDGESNLKPRYVPPQLCTPYFRGCFSEDGQINSVAIERLCGVVADCEAPSRRIDKFEGSFRLPVDHGAEQTVDLDISNLLLKGTHLKDTDWAVGVVIYTGDDTRVRQNSSDTPIKLSWLYHFINKITLGVVVAQIIILLIAVLIQKELVSSDSVRGNPYIPDDTKFADTIDYVWLFLAYMLLFSNFVPISLQVTIDFTRYFQGMVIHADQDLRLPPERSTRGAISRGPSTAARIQQEVAAKTASKSMPRPSMVMSSYSKKRSVRVQSSELNEELGLVEHIFTDKTGTLTCNRMEFRSCHVDGRTFVVDDSSGLLVLADEGAFRMCSPRTASLMGPSVPGITGSASSESNPQARPPLMTAFLMNLAINHSISLSVRDPGANASGIADYSGPSPDERALVVAASRAGIELLQRDNTSLSVRVDGGQVIRVQILQTFEFTSDRKKSSMVCRFPDGRIRLYCKGADSVILPALSAEGNPPERLQEAKEQMLAYSAHGLRVLCIAERELTEAEFAQWNTRFVACRGAQKRQSMKREAREPGADLDAQVAGLVAELETGLVLTGISGIEDKIQDGVPETLEMFRAAGIKVWMLTGDRPDTATNVAYSVRLVSTDMTLVRLSDPEWMSSKATAVGHLERLLQQQTTTKPATPAAPRLAVLLNDAAVEAIRQFGLERVFLDLCAHCESVLCARISPKQKELVIEMVRARYPDKVTMAVGDGANDVPMIQRAHIGVGIAGEEGHQASDASDYSIPAFRFLQKLVLVHGRWMNRRIATLTLYIFYKNVLLVLPQFVYGVFCLYSGQSSYYDPLLQLFNIFFTSLPVMCFAILDRDVSARTALAYPRLYQDGAAHAFLNRGLFLYWMLEATVASVLIILLPAWTVGLGPWSGLGKDNDLWALGLAHNFMVVVLANARLLLEVCAHHRIMLGLVLASLSTWWGVVYVLSSSVSFGREFYGILRVGALTQLGLGTLLCTALSLVLAFIPKALDVVFAPRPRRICRELDAVQHVGSDVVRPTPLGHAHDHAHAQEEHGHEHPHAHHVDRPHS